MIELVIYKSIQNNFIDYNKLKASCEFNISYYSALLSIIEQKSTQEIEASLFPSLVYFFIKERNLKITIRNITGIYELSLMFPMSEILDVAMGKTSDLISVSNDADKVGLLMGLYSQLTSKTRNEILEETLLFSKSMI